MRTGLDTPGQLRAGAGSGGLSHPGFAEISIGDWIAHIGQVVTPPGVSVPGKGGRTTLFMTNLGWGILQAPRPGLTTIDTGVPGLPLP